MEIGFVGLGRMGGNMVLRLLQGGHRVVAYNRTPEKLKAVQERGAVPALSPSELMDRLQERPRALWLMVPSGDATTEMIKLFAPLLSQGDIIIDGGNSNYKDSMRRSLELKEKGIHFLDAGTSGGIWGLTVGYCLMIGGPRGAFNRLEPLFKTLAPPDGYLHAGESGAGHFAKMVHNGIEYGLLQAYGEGFELLHAKKDFNFDLGRIAHLWNQGSVVRSWLLELAEKAFSSDVDSVRGYVEDSGEGRWAVAEAIENNVPAPVISLSLLERLRSRQDESFSAKVIAALRNEFGGHSMKKTGDTKE
jgi:6-phosphogluconate dehydrogenase